MSILASTRMGLCMSQITDRFIRHPSEVLTVGDVVEVTVLEVDVQKKRISSP